LTPVPCPLSLAPCPLSHVPCPLSHFPWFMWEFCLCSFNRLPWQRITFSAYLLPKKSMDNFSSYFVATGQLSMLITPNMNGNGLLSALILTHSMDQINGGYFLKVTCPSLHIWVTEGTVVKNLSFSSNSQSVAISITSVSPSVPQRPPAPHKALENGVARHFALPFLHRQAKQN
jgi:hypothetical protein